jgi:hypothetical protein
LNARFGDPEVRADPRNHRGESMVGRHYSQCGPTYLRQLGHYLDALADLDEREGALTGTGKPRAPYRRRDAALARGWARRLTEQAAQADGFGPTNSADIPF